MPTSRSDILEIAEELGHVADTPTSEPEPEAPPENRPVPPLALPVDDDVPMASPRRVQRQGRSPLEDLSSESEVTPPAYRLDRASGYVKPADRPKRARSINQFVADQLRAEVQIPYPLAPQSVLDAREAALKAIEVLDQAMHAVAATATEQAAEEAEGRKLVADAVRAGDPVPTVARTDWLTVSAEREVRYEVAHQEATAKVAAFKVAVRDGREAALQALIADIEPARAEAREALATFSAAFRRWRAAVDSGHELAVKTGLFGADWHFVLPENKHLSPRTALRDLEKLEALTNTLDKRLSGDHLLEPQGEDVPGHTMAALEHAATHGANPGANFPSWQLGKIRARVRDGLTIAAIRSRTLPKDG